MTARRRPRPFTRTERVLIAVFAAAFIASFVLAVTMTPIEQRHLWFDVTYGFTALFLKLEYRFPAETSERAA